MASQPRPDQDKPAQNNAAQNNAQQECAEPSSDGVPHTYGPFTEEEKTRLLKHFAGIQQMQRAAGIDNSGPRNRS